MEERETRIRRTKAGSPFYDETGGKPVFEGEHGGQAKGAERLNSWKQEREEAEESSKERKFCYN